MSGMLSSSTGVWLGTIACNWMLHSTSTEMLVKGSLPGAASDMWWGWMHVWVGPVMWGVVEARRWGSSTSLWGLGYMVWPGDMVGCMECVGVLVQSGQGIVCAIWYENDILVGIQVIVSW